MPETVTNWVDRVPLPIRPLIQEVTEYRGDATLVVNFADVRTVLSALKTAPETQLNVLMDLFAVDYLKWAPPTPGRFAVLYNLYSMHTHERVFVRVWLTEQNPRLQSIHDLFKAANWFEREAWDLFGIEFENHPNLTRILCHAEFEGHPLRKDYPANGFQRLKASIAAKEI